MITYFVNINNETNAKRKISTTHTSSYLKYSIFTIKTNLFTTIGKRKIIQTIWQISIREKL